MDQITKNQQIARFHFALGHTRRIRVMNALSSTKEGLTFEGLSHQTRVAGSSLTHHLRILKDAGLIRRKVKGRHSYYSLHGAALQSFSLGFPADVPVSMPH